jgi:protein SDA1
VVITIFIIFHDLAQVYHHSPSLVVTEDWESASEEEEDDDDDEEGWIDVYHSSDEEKAEAQEPTPQEVEDRKRVAQEVSASRIMTQEDFRRIQDTQMAKEAGLKTGDKPASKSRKRKRPADTPQERWVDLVFQGC